MKLIVLALTVTSLFGCAIQPPSRATAMSKAIAENSVITCDSKDMCDKIFRIASDITVEYSDMRIQSQGVNNVSTYNPVDHGDVGMLVQRVMVDSNSEKIKFIVVCDGMYNYRIIGNSCYEKVTSIYNIYKQRVANVSAEVKQTKKIKKQ